MAESPEVLTQKRRNRSSNSSTNSPDTKKPRSEEDHDGGIDESTVVAPSMAEKFQDTLQEILQKLEKLDTIERAVKNLEATVLNLETRTQVLESFQAGATKDISDLKESTNFAEEMYKTKLQGINKQYDNINAKLLNLETENQTLNNTIKELETKNLYLEAYSRRENIKFENINEFEDGSDKEDAEQVLRNFMDTELGYMDAMTMEFQRVHRLGKKKENEPRPILARFLRFKDCEKILSLGRRLKESNYKMYQDLPREIVQRRKKQMPIFKKAKENKIPAAFSKAQPDKLFVRGKLWPVGKALEL